MWFFVRPPSYERDWFFQTSNPSFLELDALVSPPKPLTETQHCLESQQKVLAFRSNILQ